MVLVVHYSLMRASCEYTFTLSYKTFIENIQTCGILYTLLFFFPDQPQDWLVYKVS